MSFPHAARDARWVHLSPCCSDDPSQNPSKTNPPMSILCSLFYIHLQFRLINCLPQIVCEHHNSKYHMARVVQEPALARPVQLQNGKAGFDEAQGVAAEMRAFPTPPPSPPAQLWTGNTQFPRSPPWPRNPGQITSDSPKKAIWERWSGHLPFISDCTLGCDLHAVAMPHILG